MKLIQRCFLSATLVVAYFCRSAHSVAAADAPDPAKEDFSSLGAAVMRLLETGDAKAFAAAAAPSMADWRAVVSTNRSASAGDPLASWQRTVDRQRAEVEATAKQMLAQAAELKVDFSRLRLAVAITPPKGLGSSRFSSIQAENESLLFTDKLLLKITAVALTNAPDAVRCKGEYVITLGRLLKFASNWRCSGGAQWSSFPDTVADERTQRELAIMAKAAKHGPLKLADDPALAELGEALKHFLQTQDTRFYEHEAMFNLDSLIALDEKRAAMSGEVPKRANTESWWNSQKESRFASVHGVVDLMHEAGIDLSKAEIKVKDAEFKSLYPRAGAGAIDGLEGNHLKVTFAVTTAAKAKSGKALSGDYVLEADEAMRLGGHWRISRKVRWHALPEGVVDAKVKAELEYESYAAENGTLPPNTLAPDIEFIRFDNGQTNQLSDLRGQVVILDFWAINCGPCQEPLALMQKYYEANPAWRDRVTVMTLSIDDTLKAARNHMNKRGWTNTFNAWAGEGDWQSAPAKAFRVTGIPTCYVINTNGVIVSAGHPMGLRAPEVVNQLLE